MRRILTLLLAAVMLFSLAACGNSDGDPTPTPSQTEPATTGPTVEPTAEPTQETAEPTESGKTLVVYFSAQHHTEAVAQAIADHLGADIFELTPAQPYTEEDLNWRNETSRVTTEHEDESRRDVELVNATPDNWADYDTVFVGYPIWWGIAAWPVNHFVTDNDFSGKTVIPFCTSSSSSLGESGTLLAQMADTGDWQEGQRFSSGADADEVAEWLDELELDK